MIPLQSVPHAIEEMKFAREELGMTGIFVRPNPYNNKMIHHPGLRTVLDGGRRSRHGRWLP